MELDVVLSQLLGVSILVEAVGPAHCLVANASLGEAPKTSDVFFPTGVAPVEEYSGISNSTWWMFWSFNRKSQ